MGGGGGVGKKDISTLASAALQLEAMQSFTLPDSQDAHGGMGTQVAHLLFLLS